MYIRVFGIVDLPTRLRARSLKKALCGLPPGSVVDFGAGTGVYSYFLSRNGERDVVAVDIDRDRVDDIGHVAETLGRSNISSVCSDERFFLNSNGKLVAGILATEVIVYCDDILGLLKSMCGQLRPGGMLVGHVPVREELFPHERHLMDKARLGSWLHEAGFQNVTIRPSLGRGAELLAEVFDTVARRPILLAAIFPLLLIVIQLTRRQPQTGNSLLFVAEKSDCLCEVEGIRLLQND